MKINENKELNGIEVSFETKPDKAILAALKSHGFRWHKVKKIWYAKATPERREAVQNIKDGKIEPVKKEPAKNKYGVQLGDVFRCSWGYDQTNVNFFQVIKLVGSCSVRVVEVTPEIIKEKPTCSMAGDFTFKLTRNPLPTKDTSIFIKDQVKGDLKRLRVDDPGNPPSFFLKSFADAHLCSGDTVTEYISWYA